MRRYLVFLGFSITMVGLLRAVPGRSAAVTPTATSVLEKPRTGLWEAVYLADSARGHGSVGERVCLPQVMRATANAAEAAERTQPAFKHCGACSCRVKAGIELDRGHKPTPRSAVLVIVPEAEVIRFAPLHAEPPPAPTRIAFIGPKGMVVSGVTVNGWGRFDSAPVIVPGSHGFPAGKIYRLKLTRIPSHESITLYPTLEVGPVTPRMAAYLAENDVPLEFTVEDFDQVLTGDFMTKVYYLPDPEFQAHAHPNVETFVSTQQMPGVDPIVEADRRGYILAILRMGNRDVKE